MEEGRKIRKNIERLRKQYPPGTQVVLRNMEGEIQMPFGLTGEVAFVDDMGSVHVKWSNGSSLALIPEEDDFEIIRKQQMEWKME